MKKIIADDKRLRHIFATNLKRFLKERGTQQQDFAREISMNHIQVTRWVTEKAAPSWDAIIAISNALGVSPSELFRDADEKAPPSSYEFELFRKFRRFADSMRA